VVSQSRRQSAGQDTIPGPCRRNTPGSAERLRRDTPDGLLALHLVPRTASPLRTASSRHLPHRAFALWSCLHRS